MYNAENKCEKNLYQHGKMYSRFLSIRSKAEFVNVVNLASQLRLVTTIESAYCIDEGYKCIADSTACQKYCVVIAAALA